MQALDEEEGYHHPDTAFPRLEEGMSILVSPTKQPAKALAKLFRRSRGYTVHPRARDATIQPGPWKVNLQWTAGVPLQGLYEFQRWLVGQIRPDPHSDVALAAQNLRDGLDFGVLVARKARQLGGRGHRPSGGVGHRGTTP